MRPVVTPGVAAPPRPGPARPASAARGARSRGGAPGSAGRGSGVTVRRLAREQRRRLPVGAGARAEIRRRRDGWPTRWRSPRPAGTAGHRSARAVRGGRRPAGDIEQRSWLAFLLAWLGPLDGDDPFGAIAAARTPWASGERPTSTAWQPARARSRPAARRGRPRRTGPGRPRRLAGRRVRRRAGWTPERRFARVYERLALPGLDRGRSFRPAGDARRAGVYELPPAPCTSAAPTGHARCQADPRDRRPAAAGAPLGRAGECVRAPLEALDLGFFNWERGARASAGYGPRRRARRGCATRRTPRSVCSDGPPPSWSGGERDRKRATLKRDVPSSPRPQGATQRSSWSGAVTFGAADSDPGHRGWGARLVDAGIHGRAAWRRMSGAVAAGRPPSRGRSTAGWCSWEGFC